MLRRIAWGLAGLTVTLGLAALVVFQTDLLLSSLDVGPLGTEAEAQAFLRDVAAFHGAPDRWSEQPEIELRVRGRVPFTPARLAFGLESSEEVELALRYRPGEHGRYAFALIDGDRRLSGRVDTTQDRDSLGLLFDSVRHLFELPFSAAAIPFRRGLPPGPNDERRAFFTWGPDAAPTSQCDQIALWSRGGQLTRMDTTGRDIAPFIVARVSLEGSVELDGFTLPAKATIYDDAGGRIVHAWEITSLRSVQGRISSLRALR